MKNKSKLLRNEENLKRIVLIFGYIFIFILSMVAGYLIMGFL